MVKSYLDHLHVIDGVMDYHGSTSTAPNGITTWASIRIKTSSGEDVFLPKTETTEQMSSYIKSALGQKVRIYYGKFIVGSKEIASIYAIDIDGRIYSEGSALDNNKKTISSAILPLKIFFYTVIVFQVITIVPMFIGVFALPLTIPFLWIMNKKLKELNSLIYLTPSSSQFEEFYNKNKRVTNVHTELAAA